MNWKLILAFISMVIDFFTGLLEKGQSKEVMMILSALKSTTRAARDNIIVPDAKEPKNG